MGTKEKEKQSGSKEKERQSASNKKALLGHFFPEWPGNQSKLGLQQQEAHKGSIASLLLRHFSVPWKQPCSAHSPTSQADRPQHFWRPPLTERFTNT